MVTQNMSRTQKEYGPFSICDCARFNQMPSTDKIKNIAPYTGPIAELPSNLGTTQIMVIELSCVEDCTVPGYRKFKIVQYPGIES